MTQYPEAVLARELGMCYAGLALVTDYDTGIDGGEAGGLAVTMAAVMEVLAANVDKARRLLTAAIPALGIKPTCACSSSGVIGPPESHG